MVWRSVVVKSWKIGECAIGGVVQISTRPRGVFEVKCLDYNDKSTIAWRFVHGYDELQSYLEEISTSYYADKMTTYFKTKLQKDEQ